VADIQTGLLKRTGGLLHFDDQLHTEYRTIRPFALARLRHSAELTGWSSASRSLTALLQDRRNSPGHREKHHS
jgi:hypothetical protein